MERWVGRVVLVTGASAGIGASLAERLVKHGMKVVGCARNLEKLQELGNKVKGEKGSFYPIKCDLKKEEEILAMFGEIKKQHGGVDVCINNAGVSQEATLINGETEKWRDILDVNVLALCICTREAVQSMKSRGINDGHIIHISSYSGHRHVPGGTAMYSASKFAVRALTEGLRNELLEAKSNIRITGTVVFIVLARRRYTAEIRKKDVGSIMGHVIKPNNTGNFYAACKYAVRALTEGLRTELVQQKSNICVTAVSPGMVKTEFALRMVGVEKGTKIYDSVPVLYADDITDSVIYALSAPPHVQIHDILMRPTGQMY